jgi:hypothetical protein
MTRAITTLGHYDKVRIVGWYRRAHELSQTSSVQKLSLIEESTHEQRQATIEDALYWLGFARHHIRQAAHLDQDDGRERATLTERLAQAEAAQSFAPSADNELRVVELRAALDEWNQRTQWHEKQAAAALQACVEATAQVISVHDDASTNDVLAALALCLGPSVDRGDIANLADWFQAVEAVYEFTDAADWREAAALAKAALASMSPSETRTQNRAHMQRLEGAHGWQGVLLGGGVNQERPRRTRGSR